MLKPSVRSRRPSWPRPSVPPKSDRVKLIGRACCPMALATLRGAIEQAVRARVPEITGVICLK